MAKETDKLANNTHENKNPLSQKRPRYDYKGCTGYKCSKWCLFVYSFFLAVIGILLVAVGCYAEQLRRNYQTLNVFLSSPAILLIVVGAVILIVAIIGCVATVYQKYLVLKIFLACLVLMLILQVALGIIAFVYREKAAAVVSDHMSFAIKGYIDDSKITSAVDYMQRELKCCGFDSFLDWEENRYYSCHAKVKDRERHPDLACGVPQSCCKSEPDKTKQRCFSTNTSSICEPRPFCSYKARALNNELQSDGSRYIVLKGCSFAFISWIEEHLDVVGGVVLGFSLPQVIGIFLAFLFTIHVDDRRHLYKATYV